MPLVQHLPDWLKNRTAGTSRSSTSRTSLWPSSPPRSGRSSRSAPALEADDHVQFALGGLTACFLLVGINHSLLAPMLALARGISPRESGLFSFQSLSTDLVLAALGVGIATFWDSNPGWSRSRSHRWC